MKNLNKRSKTIKQARAKMQILCLGISLIIGTGIQAVPLDAGRVLDFKIARSGMTRISVQNDSVEDVYAFPAEPDLITHHKSGHVFVTPDELDSVVYLTVITRNGIAQDMRLTPVAKRAEPILLDYHKPEPTPAEAQNLDREDAAVVMADFIKGIVPAGFYPIRLSEVSRGQGPTPAILVKSWQNARFRVLVFNLKNDTGETITLDNRVFWSHSDLASAFDRATLESEQTAQLFIIQKY